jgi:FkbM family methyltransferase
VEIEELHAVPSGPGVRPAAAAGVDKLSVILLQVAIWTGLASHGGTMSTISKLMRRLTSAPYQPRHWRLRPGTLDARIFREVVIDNEYRLPRRFQADDVVLDVGGHIGSFAYAAFVRGAGQIYCCEADPDNFQVLQHNMQPYGDRVVIRHAAVWRSDQPVDRLYIENPFGAKNTGGVRVSGLETAHSVPALPFDDLVRLASDSLRRPVRLAKFDCEGAEWPILLASKLLEHVQALCGEYHVGDIPAADAVAGLPELSGALLEDVLRGRGFATRTYPHPTEPRIGWFFARNMDY